MDIKRIEFVRECGQLLHKAKRNLVSCELKLGKDIRDIHAERGNPSLAPEEEYVVVTCENNYSYNICVEGNSLCAIAAAIFSQMSHK